MTLDSTVHYLGLFFRVLIPLLLFDQFKIAFSFKFLQDSPNFKPLPSTHLYKNGRFTLEMVSSRKVQSFTNRPRTNKAQVSQPVPKSNLTKPVIKKRGRRSKDKEKIKVKKEKNDLLEKFGVDFGPFGQELYEWLWPNEEPAQDKEKETLKLFNVSNRFLQSRFLTGKERGNPGNYNRDLHSYLLHNYASEKFVDIYKRLAFHMRITPRILFREVGALTGKFGINILDPNENDKNKETREDVLCLRRIKFQVYTLLGVKLLRYTMMFFLRYIRLGIPNDIKIRFLTDLLTADNMAKACRMACNQVEFGNNKDNPLNQTYPERSSFETQGYPYSDHPLYSELDEEKEGRWSPSELVDPFVFKNLGNKAKAKLVCVAAALHPKYALQILKNIVFSCGYRSERELLTNFCFNSNFNSRGARSFISKLKEERVADEKLRLAAKLSTKSKVVPDSLKSALDVLVQVPYISGLVRRHLESGRRVPSVKRARMILKLVRSEVELLPEDMVLWDVLKSVISRRVLNAHSRVYKQVSKEILPLRNFLSPSLRGEMESRGVDVSSLYKDVPALPDDLNGISKEERLSLSKKVRDNVKEIWLSSVNDSSFEETGLKILDALSATAGYKDINNVLAIVSLLSKPPENKMERLSRQPGPEFEHSPRLEFKDFKNKVL